MAGLGLGVMAYALFSVHDATNKYLVASLPVWQVLFFRSVTIVIVCLAIGRRKLLIRLVETPLKVPLAARGLLTLVAWMCYFSASRYLPLAQLLTLYFSAPILTTLLAKPLLGEHVTPMRWASVLLGFVGVGMQASWPMLLVLASAAMWGYAIILMRQIARQEPSILQMLVQNLTFLVLTGALSIFTWVSPDPFQLMLLFAIGVIGGIGQYCLFEGSRLAPAAVMSAMEYTSLLWAFVLGYLIFGDIPTLPVWIGAATILLSGVVLVTSEWRARKA
jgi:drug/metabolite transporter (DMT)-like permease